jgi:hypothetical protein
MHSTHVTANHKFEDFLEEVKVTAILHANHTSEIFELLDIKEIAQQITAAQLFRDFLNTMTYHEGSFLFNNFDHVLSTYREAYNTEEAAIRATTQS